MFSINNNEIEITRGDSAVINLTAENYIFKEGDTIYFTVKESVYSKNVLIQKVIEIAEEVESIQIKLEPSDTKELKYRDYVYDVQLVFANKDVNTIISPSKFNVCEEVTYE